MSKDGYGTSLDGQLAEALKARRLDEYDDPFAPTKLRRLRKFAKVYEALPEALLRRRADKRRKVTPIARLRAANKVPEAMVKVASYGGGRASAVEQLDYISRNGELELEMGNGDVIDGREDIRDLIDEWAMDFHQRRNGARNTIHMVVSAPEGSNPEAVLKAGRGFAAGTFGENHPYVLVRHDDCDHPHVHIVARMRGEDGSLFQIEPGGFHELRERFAGQCRENGIEMNATPRQVRGASRGESMALRKMREAGRTPEVDKQAEAMVRAEGAQPSQAARMATKARREGLREEAEAHRDLARALEARAEQDPDRREALMRHAARLHHLADHLDGGGAPTRPQQVREALRGREGPGESSAGSDPSSRSEPQRAAEREPPPQARPPAAERDGEGEDAEKRKRKILERERRREDDDRDR